MYKLISRFGEAVGAYKEENGFRISFLFDPANTDYQEFLRWCSEGNEPLPADGEPAAEPVAEPLPPDEVPE